MQKDFRDFTAKNACLLSTFGCYEVGMANFACLKLASLFCLGKSVISVEW
jgi:hypothetical protein